MVMNSTHSINSKYYKQDNYIKVSSYMNYYGPKCSILQLNNMTNLFSQRLALKSRWIV